MILAMLLLVAGGAQAQMARKVFLSAAGSRDFLIYRPANFPARAEDRSLVVMLHGCAQNADDFARGTRMNAAADTHGFLVIYPEQTAAANATKCWNWFVPEQSTRDHGEVALLAALIDSVAFAEGVPEKHVSLVGLSAGASMAANLAIAYPERYAALGLHSGIPALAARDLMSAFAATKNGFGEGAALGAAAWTAMGHYARPIPVFAVQGADDKVVSPTNLTITVAQWTAINGHASNRKVPVESQLFPGIGHGWSGGAAEGSFTAPGGPDATGLIVNFLVQTGAIIH
ncbi:MAG: polyhydroxyalkanoic acid depolymerase [Gemmatimonadetes bacterium]|nr:polyhydroxyalkanoic acid depolymerase [Gemmatimonadota bacterium]